LFEVTEATISAVPVRTIRRLDDSNNMYIFPLAALTRIKAARIPVPRVECCGRPIDNECTFGPDATIKMTVDYMVSLNK
jgi:hypothetical protein